MKLKITSLHDRPVGLGGNAMLPPGCSAVIEVTEAERKAWKECRYVKVQNVDRPASRSNKAADADPVDSEYVGECGEDGAWHGWEGLEMCAAPL